MQYIHQLKLIGERKALKRKRVLEGEERGGVEEDVSVPQGFLS
jgi:hypothetical protein